MPNTLDSNSLELMKVFEQRTGAKVADVVDSESSVVFIVEEGQIGKAIGKQGSTLAKLREAFSPKNVEVIEDASDVRTMIDKTLRGAIIRNVEQNDNHIVISVDSTTRGIAIGKGGSNIKKLKVALKRKFGIEDTKIL